MKLTIQRTVKGLDGNPTLGHAATDDGFECKTLERSANGDHPCIPAGTYMVDEDWHHPLDLKKRYRCPELRNVPGRSQIQWHIANRVDQLLGCIAPGEQFAPGELWIESSGDAFRRSMAHFAGKFPFELEIIDPPETPTT